MSELILEKNNELPDGWETSSIEVITKNHDGKRIPVSAELRKGMKGKYPYYGASGIIDYVEKPIFDGKFLLIGEDGANLVSRKTPIAFIAKGKFWVNNHAHVLTTLCNIPLEFLSYYINNINLTPWISGTAQPKLNQTNMNKISVLLPPLNEQKRIVQKIESIFSQIDAGKENLEVLASHVKSSSGSLNVLKASVLKQAFEGRLVPQDHNMDSEFIWSENINLLDEQIDDFEKRNPRDEPYKEFKYIEISSITNNKIINFKKILGKNTPSRARNVVRKNDVIYGTTRPYYRNVILISEDFDNEVCSTGFCVLRSNNCKLEPTYLFHYMLSDVANNQILPAMRGGNYPAVSNKDVISIDIPLPPLSEQHRIVSKIESIFDKIDAIEKHVDDSLIKLESLKKSVLKKAFEGNLVPQDPNDEPASVLLERIKQEKLLIRKK